MQKTHLNAQVGDMQKTHLNAQVGVFTCRWCKKTFTLEESVIGSELYCCASCRKKFCDKKASEITRNTRISKKEDNKVPSKILRQFANKDVFAEEYAKLGGYTGFAEKYSITREQVATLRKEVFGSDSAKNIIKQGKTLMQNKLNAKLNKEHPTRSKLKPIEIHVYKITDHDAFFNGGTGTYEGLELDHIELHTPLGGVLK